MEFVCRGMPSPMIYGKIPELKSKHMRVLSLYPDFMVDQDALAEAEKCLYERH